MEINYLSYEESLRLQAKNMSETISKVSGEIAFLDPRFQESLFNAFVIIRNDTRRMLLEELIYGSSILPIEIAQQNIIKEYVHKFAKEKQIAIYRAK